MWMISVIDLVVYLADSNLILGCSHHIILNFVKKIKRVSRHVQGA